MIESILYISFICVVSSLTSLCWAAILVQGGEVFAWVPKLITMKWPKNNGQHVFSWIWKPLWQCAKCVSGWVSMISLVYYIGLGFYLIPSVFITILLTDQLTKQLGYTQ